MIRKFSYAASLKPTRIEMARRYSEKPEEERAKSGVKERYIILITSSIEY